MRDEPNRWYMLETCSRGDRCHHVAVFVDRRVTDAEGTEFFDEQARQQELAGRARTGAGRLVRPRIDDDVAKKPVECRSTKYRHRVSTPATACANACESTVWSMT